MLLYKRTEQMVHTSKWLTSQPTKQSFVDSQKIVFKKTLKKCLTKIKQSDTLEISQEGDENQPLDDDRTYSLYDGLQPSSVLSKLNTRFHAVGQHVKKSVCG